MALYASEGSSTTYEPIPEGTYPGICYGLIDLGEQYSEKFDKLAHKCRIIWEVVGETIEVDGKEINRSISKDYTLSLNEKSALRKDLRAWRGREFTAEELQRFDLKNILRVPCMLNIVHVARNDKTYANIAGIMSMPKGMPKPEQTNETVYWDFVENEIGDAAWNLIPEFLQERIKESETYKFVYECVSDKLSDARKDELIEGKSYKKFHPNGFQQLSEDEEVPFN